MSQQPIKVTREILKDLKPCKDRWENYLSYYPDFEGTLTELLTLGNITPADKIWVFVRLPPRFLVECFAVDCAFSASAYFSAYASAAASYASACSLSASASADYAAYASAASTVSAASYAAAYDQERENQVDAMIMLLEGL
jgi:hypothetical protein